MCVPRSNIIAACDHVCKAILEISNCVRSQQANVSILNMVELFWRPLGIQLIGLLISHIRKQKITQEGSFVLMRDLEEYCIVGSVLECSETLDMLECIKEIGDLGFAFVDKGYCIL